MGRVVKNYFYNTSVQILNVLMPLISVPYVSRVLQAEGVGLHSYIFSVAELFVIFAVLGISSYGQREIAFVQDCMEERSRVFWELGIAKAITSCLTIIVYLVFVLLQRENQFLFLIQGIIIVSALFDFSWFFQGIEKFGIVAIRTVIVKACSLIMVFVVVKTQNDLWKYFLIMSSSTLVLSFSMIPSLRKNVCFVPIKTLHPWRHIRGLIEFFLPVVAVQLYSYVDRIMLGSLLPTTEENGYYEQARKIVDCILKIILSLNAVLYPRIASLNGKGEYSRISEIYRISLKVSFAVLLPALVGIIVIAEDFTALFFGEGFSKVALLLRLSPPLVVFMCVGNFVGVQYLNPTNQQNKATVIYFVSAIMNIVLNYYLIPVLLSLGALVSSIVTEFISCMLQVLLFKKSKYNFRLTEGIYVYAISAILMGASVYAVGLLINGGLLIKLIIQISCGVILYPVLLLLFREKYFIPYITNIIRKR